jgi:hypothetical protein
MPSLVSSQWSWSPSLWGQLQLQISWGQPWLHKWTSGCKLDFNVDFYCEICDILADHIKHWDSPVFNAKYKDNHHAFADLYHLNLWVHFYTHLQSGVCAWCLSYWDGSLWCFDPLLGVGDTLVSYSQVLVLIFTFQWLIVITTSLSGSFRLTIPLFGCTTDVLKFYLMLLTRNFKFPSNNKASSSIFL